MKPASRAATLEALASPVRQELMSHLGDGAATVQVLARRLGRSRQSLYYHVLALERAGLIRVAATQGEGRSAERVYAVAVDVTRGEARALNRREREAAARATAAMLRLTQRELVAATRRAGGEPGAPILPVVAVRAKARLDRDALARARALVGELIALFRAAKGKHVDERPFALTMVLTPSRESVVTSGSRRPRGDRSRR